MPHIRITRWRRGSFLTVYRFETQNSTQWWFYLPFNLGFGFSVPHGDKEEVEIENLEPDESGPHTRSRPEHGKYWN